MAVTEVRQVNRTATEHLEGQAHERTVEYLVLCSDKTDDAGVVLASSDIEPLGSFYVGDTETDLSIVVMSRQVSNPKLTTDGGITYRVLVTFGPKIEAGGITLDSPVNQKSNPTDRKPVWTKKFRQTQTYVEKDRQDNPIKNSAGAPIDGGLQLEKSSVIFTVVWFGNEYSFNESLQYQDSINSIDWETDFFTFPAKSAKVIDHNAEKVWENGVECYKKTLIVDYNEDLWHPTKLLDAGWYQRDPVSGKPKVILDRQSRPITQITPLDGDGGALGVDADLVYLDFYPYREVSFAGMFE